jgi:hypothetical protein
MALVAAKDVFVFENSGVWAVITGYFITTTNNRAETPAIFLLNRTG